MCLNGDVACGGPTPALACLRVPSRRTLAVLLGGSTLLASYPFLPRAGQVAVFTLIVAATPVAMVAGSWRAGSTQRRPWQLIAAGLAVFGAVDLAFDLQHASAVGQGSVARLTYAIGYPLLVAGLLLLVVSIHGGWEWFALIEVGILAVALMLVQLATAVAFTDASAVRPTVGFATTLTYTLAGGVLLACAEHAVVAAARRAPACLALLFAVVALVVADDVYAATPHAYALGSWPNVVWLLAYVCFAAAAVGAPARAASVRSAPAPGMPVARLSSLGAALLALPGLIVFSAVDALGGPMDIVLAAGALVLVVLVLVRISGLVGSAVRSQSDELAARRRAEGTQRQLVALVGSLQGGVLLLDAQRRIVLANDAFCRIFGLARTPAELTGTPTPHADETVAGLVADPERFAETTELLISSRRLTSGEEIDFRDGRSFLRDHIPVFRDGVYEGSLWHYLDISDLKATEVELAKARDKALEATRLKSEFLATMSHEIRTPMYGVIGAIDLLGTTSLDEEQRELTTVLHNSAEALLSLLNDILDFSKIEAHKLTLADDEIDVRAVVEGVLDVVAVDARRNELWLSSYVSPAIPGRVRGDASRLRQVLLNLVGNAVKFTPAGEVAVRAELQSSDERHVELRFTVRDTGIGIADDAQAGLFEPFTQIDASTSRLHAGTGLGLAICARLTELMGGSISCESALGSGTVMTAVVSLERVESRDENPAALPAEGRRIVLVGEHPHTLAALAATLEGAGAATRCFASVAEAEAAFDSTDLVLCDDEQAHLLPARPPAIVLAGGNVPTGDGDVAAVLPVSRARLLELVDTATSTEPADTYRRNGDEPGSGSHDLEPDATDSTILVVEDDELNRQLVVRQLARLGYAAQAVGSGLDAIDALEHRSYAAVLMDCRMPGMDGIAATKLIRDRETSRDRHVIIAITADAQPQDRIRCLTAGMDDYLVKPLTIDRLGTCLARWLTPAQTADEAVSPETLARLTDEVGDDTVTELIRLWADALPARIDSLHRAVADDDPELAFATAHVLKSTTAGLGGANAAQLAAELEDVARTGKMTASGSLVSDLTTELRRVSRELRAAARSRVRATRP